MPARTRSSVFAPKNILCPVDFSDLSALALKYAAAGAVAFDAKVTVLHAITFEVPPYVTKSQAGQLQRQLSNAKLGAREYLTRYIRGVLGAQYKDIALTLAVVEKDPVEAILEAAGGISGLVVMGTHGRGGAQRLFLGSVAESVSRHSSVPVFVVRQKEHGFLDVTRSKVQPSLRQILCPVNYSDVARSSLEHAVSLAERFNAKLTVLHVGASEAKEDQSKARDKLCAWIPKSLMAKCPINPLAMRGNAVDQIIRFARNTEQDLIVLGARRRRSPKSWLWGTTTDQVLRLAPVPVLVVPRHG